MSTTAMSGAPGGEQLQRVESTRRHANVEIDAVLAVEPEPLHGVDPACTAFGWKSSASGPARVVARVAAVARALPEQEPAHGGQGYAAEVTGPLPRVCTVFTDVRSALAHWP